MNQTLTIRIPKDMKNDLEELSHFEHKPISDIVRDSLRRTIAIRRFRKIRNQFLPLAKAQGLLTDDDIFNIVS